MSRLLQLLNVLAVCLLGGVFAPFLVAQTQAGSRSPERFPPEDPERRPNTLEVYPSHAGDPAELVRIMKDGQEVVPGSYALPQIAGNIFQDTDAVKNWLNGVSFTLKSRASKTIVSVGIGVVFPARRTDLTCSSITGHRRPDEPWCEAHPHYCDGGCPERLAGTLHWGLIPGWTRSGLEARYRGEAEGIYGDRVPLEGKEPLRLAPDEEFALFAGGQLGGRWPHLRPRHPFSEVVNQLLHYEGIEESTGTEPCSQRENSKTGCAFAEVPKFNMAIDIVYFEDGTIWGNYGYGYALPNPDGIFTRVDSRDFPGIARPAFAPN